MEVVETRFKKVSLQNPEILISCGLDISSHLDRDISRRFSIDISRNKDQNQNSILRASNISSDLPFFLVKGKRKKIQRVIVDDNNNNNSKNERVVNEYPFEHSLLTSNNADISVDEINHLIVLDFSNYEEFSPFESSTVIISHGKDTNTQSMVFIKASIKFKNECCEHKNDEIITIDSVDSIYNFRFDVNLCMGEENKSDVRNNSFIPSYKSSISNYYSLLSIFQNSQKLIFSSLKNILLFQEKPKDVSPYVFFVNGWNAWSYCGSVRKNKELELYGMPDVFAKAFHAGGAALKINSHSNSNRNSETNSDAIASDMFAILADLSVRSGILGGFLSQQNQFGSVSTNKSYSTLAFITQHDGLYVNGPSSCNTIDTEWMCVQVLPTLPIDPLANYMHLVGLVNGSQNFIPLGEKGYENTLSHLEYINKRFQASNENLNIENSFLNATVEKENQMVKNENVKFRLPTGWCSWYHFYEHISERCLEENLKLLPRLIHRTSDIHHLDWGSIQQFNLFQVDDGYQSQWGDWAHLKKKEFPSQSLLPLVMKIKEFGLVPGIWMAPFACDKNSLVAKKYPHWILKNARGIPANSGNCGKWFYGLDVSNPEVQDYVKSNLTLMVREWGFRYLKLDFLYAAILDASSGSLMNKNITSAQAMSNIMNFVNTVINDLSENGYSSAFPRNISDQSLSLSLANPIQPSLSELTPLPLPIPSINEPDLLSEAGSVSGSVSRSSSSQSIFNLKPNDSMVPKDANQPVVLLGCGAPIGAVIGKVHINRISSDAGLTWYPMLGPVPINDKWNLPAAINMIRNTLCRLSMHNKWWVNDPDCLILRQEAHFTQDELIGIAVVKALSGGPIILSDDLKSLSDHRMLLALKLLPPIGLGATPLDLLEREIPELLRLELHSDSFYNCDNGQHPGYKVEFDNTTTNNNGQLQSNVGHSWVLFGVCNWEEIPKSYSIPIRQFIPHSVLQANINEFCKIHIFNFFKEKYTCIELCNPHPNASNEDISYGGCLDDLRYNSEYINPHSADLLAVRFEYIPVPSDRPFNGNPIYLGGNFHFSCGSEISSFNFESNNYILSDLVNGSVTKNNYSNCATIRFKSGFGSHIENESNFYIWVFIPIIKHQKATDNCCNPTTPNSIEIPDVGNKRSKLIARVRPSILEHPVEIMGKMLDTQRKAEIINQSYHNNNKNNLLSEETEIDITDGFVLKIPVKFQLFSSKKNTKTNSNKKLSDLDIFW